jgi:DNA-binding MarR family transcriptional regulator
VIIRAGSDRKCSRVSPRQTAVETSPLRRDEPAAADAADAADAAEILRAITRISYLITRARRHDRVRTVAAVPLDRAAVMVLGQLAEAGPVRPGELAARLRVEAPHVTRQVQRLQQVGYADRVPDPGDRRAQLIQLTPAGRAASDRIREAGETGMQAALAHWPPEELHQLATLLHRMVDDFLAYTAAEEPAQPAR